MNNGHAIKRRRYVSPELTALTATLETSILNVSTGGGNEPYDNNDGESWWS